MMQLKHDFPIIYHMLVLMVMVVACSDADGRRMRPEAGSTQDAEGTWDAGSTTFKVHPGGKGATQEISEVAAHKGERDAASY